MVDSSWWMVDGGGWIVVHKWIARINIKTGLSPYRRRKRTTSLSPRPTISQGLRWLSEVETKHQPMSLFTSTYLVNG